MASKKHHSSPVVKYLGASAELPTADLPTLRDVLKKCQLLRERFAGPANMYEVSAMVADVLPLVLDIWKRANVKLVELPVRHNDFALAERIKRNWKTLNDIANKRVKVGQRERQTFTSNLDKLFSILTCNCDFIDCAEAKCQTENCGKAHISCKSPRDIKIPPLELQNIRDQRQKVGTRGECQMGGKDDVETKRQQNALKRKADEEIRKEKRAMRKKEADDELEGRAKAFAEMIKEEEKVEVPEESEEEEIDPTFRSEKVERQIRADKHQQNRTPLPMVASIAVHGQVPHRIAAAIATATLIDQKINTADNKSQIISKNKIQREIACCLEATRDSHEQEDGPITCILFDGRNDRTKVLLEDENGKKYPSTKSEEHVTMTAEPGGAYVGHLSPEAKDAQTIAADLLQHFLENGIDKTLMFIGGDSTNVNTGAQGGVMHLLEKALGHRLHRIICELHTNELSLRHVIQELDGPTSGANSFSGAYV